MYNKYIDNQYYLKAEKIWTQNNLQILMLIKIVLVNIPREDVDRHERLRNTK